MAKQPQGLPRDARKLIRDFERRAQAVWDKAAADVERLCKELAGALKAAQDAHVRAGRLDEALAVRDQINRIATVFRTGQIVEVESEGVWWEAEILNVRGSRYHIHYIGWEDEWNEWVGKDRVRFRAPARQTRRRRGTRGRN